MEIDRQSTVFDKFQETKDMYNATMSNIVENECNTWVLSKDIGHFKIDRPFTIYFSESSSEPLKNNPDLLKQFIHGNDVYGFPINTSHIKVGDMINIFVPSIYSKESINESKIKESIEQPTKQSIEQIQNKQHMNIRVITWNMGGVTMSKEEWKEELQRYWMNKYPGPLGFSAPSGFSAPLGFSAPSGSLGPSGFLNSLDTIDTIDIIILITQEAPSDSKFHEAFADVLNSNQNHCFPKIL